MSWKNWDSKRKTGVKCWPRWPENSYHEAFLRGSGNSQNTMLGPLWRSVNTMQDKMAVSRHAVELQQAVIMQLRVSYIKNFSYCGSLSWQKYLMGVWICTTMLIQQKNKKRPKTLLVCSATSISQNLDFVTITYTYYVVLPFNFVGTLPIPQ